MKNKKFAEFINQHLKELCPTLIAHYTCDNCDDDGDFYYKLQNEL